MKKGQKNRELARKNQFYEHFLKKYFRLRYLVLGIILILLFSIYTDIFKAAILIAIFLPLGVYSFLAGKFIPHINVETISGSTLLIGYATTPLAALFFGLTAGIYAMIKSGHIRYLMIVRIIVTAIVGFVMAFFREISFNANFIIGIIAMNVILYFIYMVIDPDPIQNITHRASHLLSNVLILRFVFVALYDLIKFI